MDEGTNQLQRILGFDMMENCMLSSSIQDGLYHYDSSAFLQCPDSRISDKSYFFVQSPNLFQNDQKISQEDSDSNKIDRNLQKGCFQGQIQDFEEVFSSEEFLIEKKSREIFYSESSTESKKQFEEYITAKKPKKYKKKKNQTTFDQIKELKDFQFEISTCRKSGSLKNFSEILYQIMMKFNNLTFISLGQRLIKFHKKQQTEKGKVVEERNLKNIKRRVYDALNVMISAGVIEKIGKRIQFKRKRSGKQVQFFKTLNQMQNSKITMGELSENILKSQMNLQNKRVVLKQLTERKEDLQKFFKQKIQKQEISLPSERIKFPFVCLTADETKILQISHIEKFKHESVWYKDNSLTRDSYEDENYVSIMFNAAHVLDGINIEGDVDFIQRVGRLNQNRKNK